MKIEYEEKAFDIEWQYRTVSNWAMIRNQIAINSEMQERRTKYENI